jgi:hypothetical protein
MHSLSDTLRVRDRIKIKKVLSTGLKSQYIVGIQLCESIFLFVDIYNHNSTALDCMLDLAVSDIIHDLVIKIIYMQDFGRDIDGDTVFEYIKDTHKDELTRIRHKYMYVV